MPPVYKGDHPWEGSDLFGRKHPWPERRTQTPKTPPTPEKRRYYEPHVCPHTPKCPHRAACDIQKFLKDES